jgi:hypothetical protein
MVYLIAADLLEHRGLLKLRGSETGIWHGHQLPATDTRKGRITTVGAIGSACVHVDCIRDEVAHLVFFHRFAGVEFVAQVEDGHDTASVVELLRACADAPGTR